MQSKLSFDEKKKDKHKLHSLFFKKSKHEGNKPTLVIEFLDEPNIEQYYFLIKEISIDIQSIKEQEEILKNYYQQYSDSWAFATTKNIKILDEKIADFIKQIYIKGNEIQIAFQQANPDVFFKNSALSAEEKVRYQSIHEEHYVAFKSIWVELYKEKQEHKTQKFSYSKKYLTVLYPHAKAGDIDTAASLMAEDSALSDNLVLNNTLDLVDMLHYVKHRHNEVLKLEKSLIEVNQLFIDMQILTENQGYSIDKISENVRSAKEKISDSVTLLSEAKESAQNRSFFHK